MERAIIYLMFQLFALDHEQTDDPDCMMCCHGTQDSNNSRSQTKNKFNSHEIIRFLVGKKRDKRRLLCVFFYRYSSHLTCHNYMGLLVNNFYVSDLPKTHKFGQLLTQRNTLQMFFKIVQTGGNCVFTPILKSKYQIGNIFSSLLI